MNKNLQLQLESIIGGVTVEWSSNFLIPGQSNAGTLTVNPFPSTETFPISQGNKIGFYNLPVGWSITSNAPALWSVTTFPYRSNNITALEYLGNTPVNLTQTIPLTFVIPVTTTPSISLETQIFDASATPAPLSTPAYLTLGLIQPSQPLVAYATNQTVVLLSNITDVQVDNTLLCTLLNRSGAPIPTASVTLSIQGCDANGGIVVIPEGILSSVVITGGGVSWNYSNSQWTTTLTNLPKDDQISVTISNLPLTEATLNLLQVEFTLTNIPDQSAYNTSAWFQAYGPYTLLVTLDIDQPEVAENYALFETSTPGIFTVNSLSSTNTTPPLQPYLVDAAGDLAYPPILGGFSWSKTSINYPSTYSLQSSNYLYYVISNGGAYVQLSSTQINLAILTSTSPTSAAAPLIFSTELLNGTYFGMNLASQNFSNWTNLTNAAFQNCSLTQTNFTSANLSSAVLTGATISSQINFSDAILANINFVTLGFNLAGVNFSGAILAETTFSGLTLTTTNFTGANFSNANFSNANLKGNATLSNISSFSYANFSGAQLNDLTITSNGNLDFSYANFSNASFDGSSIFANTDFGEMISFSQTNLNKASFYNTVICAQNPGGQFSFPSKLSCFACVDFSNAQLDNISLAPVMFFAACQFTSTTMTNNNFTSAVFICDNFPSANFAGSNLSGSCIGIPNNNDQKMMAPLLNQERLGEIAKKFTPTRNSPWCTRWQYIRSEIYTHILFRRWKHPHKRKVLRLLCGSFIRSAHYLSLSNPPPISPNTDITGAQFGQATFASMISSNLVGTPASLPTGWAVQGGQFVQS